MNRLNLLLLILGLNVALVASGAEAGFGELFGKKNKDKGTTTPAPQAHKATTTKSAESTEAGHKTMAAADAHSPTKGGATATGGARRPLRPNLDEVRAAKEEQDRLAAESAAAEANSRSLPRRPKYQAPARGGSASAASKMIQGRRRHAASAEPELEDEQDEEDDERGDGEDDDPDSYEQAMAAYRKQQGGGKAAADQEVIPAEGESGLMGRITNKNLREQLAAKFVSTHKSGAGGGEKRASGPRVKVNRAKKTLGGADAGAEAKKSSYWGKQFGKALKVTKKGIRAGASAIADLPKYMEQAADSVNALLQLDGKGKLLALIENVRGDIHFVRKEFSQFTLNWSPIMEKGLNYLGDEGLDKIKWSDRDELDFKKDALHSLVFGYEFMRLMVAWRENLLIAHEAYKLWLESLKKQYEEKHFDVDEDLLMQLSTIQNYLLLSAWEEIDERTHEIRLKLDHLMEIEDDRPKNYESEYFRNIVVLQEMYLPTVEELDKEQTQVQESISTSGVVVDNLEQVTEFYDHFRKSVESDEITDVDCKVPKEMIDFLTMLEPQVEYTALVYTKGFIKDLKQASEERQVERARRQQEEQDEEDEEEGDDYEQVATTPKPKRHWG